MTIRCKMKVVSIGRRMGTRDSGRKRADGTSIWEACETRDVELAAVFGGAGANDENKKFWAATPSGSIKFNTLNVAIADALELDREYYVDITPAPFSD